MVTIAVFGKQGCPKCATTKNKIEHYLGKWRLDHEVRTIFHDLETIEGRAEGAFYDVNDIPVTIIEREGRQLARWDGRVPNSDAIRAALQEASNVSAD